MFGSQLGSCQGIGPTCRGPRPATTGVRASWGHPAIQRGPPGKATWMYSTAPDNDLGMLD